MSEPTTVSSSPKRKRNWLGILLKVGVALLVLVLVAYFVVTSSFFLKSVILPRVSKTLNASVTVSDASIHPFSAVILHDLKVQAAGKDPLVTVKEVRLRYHLWDIIGGNIHVDEIAVDSPTVELVVSPDGTSNLDPILKALQEKSSAEIQPAPASGPSKPVKIDLAKLTVSNANLRQTINYPGGTRDVTEITNVNVTLSNLKNGDTAKLALAAGIHVDKNSPAGPQGKMVASVNGNFDCAFSPDLKPGTVNGGVNLAVSQTGGAFTNLDAFGVALACDVTPSEIKQLAVKFQKAGETLGELTVTGPFSAEKMEGKLDVELSGIDRRLLNLAGGPMGADFGTTTISSSNEIELAKGSSVITINGKFNVDKLSLTRAGQSTPTLDFSVAYNVMADRTAQIAEVHQLQIALTPTARATNRIQFSGQVNLSKTNTVSGNLKLTADSLDFTRYYDLVAGGNIAATNAPVKVTATANPTPAGPGQEPPPVHLPLQDFTVAANIGQIYLHEIAITNFELAMKINDSHIVVDPFRMNLNGASVNSTVDVDLGVPGYKYDISFSAKKIPLTPLVDTFQPDRAGQLGGTVIVAAQIKGSGVTGASLKENLAGQYDLEMTNLNLAVINIRNPLLRSVINVVATLPQLIKSPENIIGSLLGSATGKGGLVGDLEKSPLDYIGVQGSVGSGQVELKQATVRSSEFDINAAGDVMLDSVLTNSTLKIPVTVSLSQALAKQLNLASTNTPANATYVALPQFLTMTGTLGAPKANIDKVALAGTTMKALSGNLLKSSGTNASPVGGLLDGLFKHKK